MQPAGQTPSMSAETPEMVMSAAKSEMVMPAEKPQVALKHAAGITSFSTNLRSIGVHQFPHFEVFFGTFLSDEAVAVFFDVMRSLNKQTDPIRILPVQPGQNDFRSMPRYFESCKIGVEGSIALSKILNQTIEIWATLPGLPRNWSNALSTVHSPFPQNPSRTAPEGLPV